MPGQPAARPGLSSQPGGGLRGPDRLLEVALVARARRAPLLNANRHRLLREDLEDCYGQATLELLDYVRRGNAFSGRQHIAGAIEVRFLSRVHDRQRAIGGRSRSQAAMASSLRFGAGEGPELEDPRLDVQRIVEARSRLEGVIASAGRLSRDQRLVLRTQLDGMSPAQLCALEGWSAEKYRKVAQRARRRLKALVDA